MTSSIPSPLTSRELALATSGLATVHETLTWNEVLAPALDAGYPEPDDATAWADLRAGGLAGRSQNTPELPAGLSWRRVRHGGVPCVEITPQGGETIGTYIHFHGGGWSYGSPEDSIPALGDLVAATGLRALSVGYRLAPENMLDAIVDDCVDAARAITSGGGYLAIGGESAGAHLAAATLIRLRDEGATPFRAAILTFGVYDLAGTPGRLNHKRASNIATLARGLLRSTDPALLRDSGRSPLYSPLDGMPPARFVCGTRDPALDDTLMMAARWSAVALAEVDLVAAADHAFTLAPSAATLDALRAEAAFLRRSVAAHRGPSDSV